MVSSIDSQITSYQIPPGVYLTAGGGKDGWRDYNITNEGGHVAYGSICTRPLNAGDALIAELVVETLNGERLDIITAGFETGHSGPEIADMIADDKLAINAIRTALMRKRAVTTNFASLQAIDEALRVIESTQTR